MIVRPDYIRAITPFIDQPLVKILAGVRRCGKSTIFEMIVDELLSRNSQGSYYTETVHRNGHSGRYFRERYV